MNRLLPLILFAGVYALIAPLNAKDKPGIVKGFEAKNAKPAKQAKPAGKAKAVEAPLSKFVKLELKTSPRVKASVKYGRKRLGYTPLKTKLKRNSGPVDIVIKAPGYITLNTRIFTNADTKLTVKLTKEEDANTLYGYKEKIPPDAGLMPPDAGVAPTVTPSQGTVPTPPSTTTPAAPSAP